MGAVGERVDVGEGADEDRRPMTEQANPTQEVLRTWDGVAPAWERHRKRLFESLRVVSDWLIEAIHPAAGETVLELNAGPGETDFSPPGASDPRAG